MSENLIEDLGYELTNEGNVVILKDIEAGIEIMVFGDNTIDEVKHVAYEYAKSHYMKKLQRMAEAAVDLVSQSEYQFGSIILAEKTIQQHAPKWTELRQRLRDCGFDWEVPS